MTASYDLYLTQRLILKTRFRCELSFTGDDRFGTGEGVTETDIGLRLRCEITREIAPYNRCLVAAEPWLNRQDRPAPATGRIVRSRCIRRGHSALVLISGIPNTGPDNFTGPPRRNPTGSLRERSSLVVSTELSSHPSAVTSSDGGFSRKSTESQAS